MEECRSCSNVLMSQGLFTSLAQFGIRKRFLSGFISNNALNDWGSHVGGWGLKRQGR